MTCIIEVISISAAKLHVGRQFKINATKRRKHKTEAVQTLRRSDIERNEIIIKQMATTQPIVIDQLRRPMT